MRAKHRFWYNWLKQLASSEDNAKFGEVYSNGRYLWATDGYSLYLRKMALGKQGTVTLDEEGQFVVDESKDLPVDISRAFPITKPIASVLIDTEKLMRALDGQMGVVRLTIFGEGDGLEVASSTTYALVMPLFGFEDDCFWRPEKSPNSGT